MPYIKKEQREIVDEQIKALVEAMNNIPDFANNRAGIFNYVVTKIVLSLMDDQPKYDRINELIGALECCKLEFYRRLPSKYESYKAQLNGDVYPHHEWYNHIRKEFE